LPASERANALEALALSNENFACDVFHDLVSGIRAIAFLDPPTALTTPGTMIGDLENDSGEPDAETR